MAALRQAQRDPFGALWELKDQAVAVIPNVARALAKAEAVPASDAHG